MTKPLLGRCDARPRLHFWPDGSWSRGVSGLRNQAQSVGEAVEWALQEIEHQPAVMIFEGDARG